MFLNPVHCRKCEMMAGAKFKLRNPQWIALFEVWPQPTLLGYVPNTSLDTMRDQKL